MYMYDYLCHISENLLHRIFLQQNVAGLGKFLIHCTENYDTISSFSIPTLVHVFILAPILAVNPTCRYPLHAPTGLLWVVLSMDSSVYQKKTHES